MEPETRPATYHVFINHRGPDTKRNLASLITRELRIHGLNVFLDKDELRPGGGSIYPSIQNAILSASVHITIFSKHYAESHSCLRELCWILNSSHRRTIIPVFYDVQPCQVGGTHREPYAKAFQDHQGKGKITMEVVTEWKEALKKASEIPGFVFQTDESDYGNFLNEIGQLVLKYVKPDPFEVAKHPVGLDQALEDLENKIQNQSATKLVGISGIGGVGKSTLAKLFFNLKCWDFRRFCYLPNIREQKGNLTSLQRQLVRALHGNDINILDTETGKTILRNGVKGVKILIVLDDVDDMEQIERLLDIDAVEPGSMILVTCRDKNILEGYNAFWYDLQPLRRDHAQGLFCRHAFLQSEPLEGYKDLVEEFLDICGGLPFCLKILGDQLACKCDKRYWKQRLEKFSQGGPLPDVNRVIKTLRVSYEAMDSEEEKELFLDIGCFFVGEDKELALNVSDGLFYGCDVQSGLLENLRKKCLVHFECGAESHHEIEISGKDLNPQGNRHLIKPLCKFGGEYRYVESHLPPILPQRRSKIRMQRQVRELARHIVREDIHSGAKPLRLTCSIDIEKMLNQDGSNTCRIRGILIPSGQNPPHLTNTIMGVRLLVVEHPIDLSCFFGSALSSGNLVWLRLRHFGFISIPSTISVRCLRVLEFQGPNDHLESLFSHLTRKHEMPTKLLELSVDAKGGASASTSTSRQHVYPQHSMESSDRNISSTHDSVMPSFHHFLGWIGTDLKDLNKIVLKNIPSLQLRLIGVSNLGNLTHLDLSGSNYVTKLRTLPIDFSNLRNLTHLDLSGSTDLTELPPSFSQLLKLQHLALRDCEELSIPTEILGEISSLEYIDFKGCAQLKNLPEGIASQTSLRYLNLLKTSLQELPSNLNLLDKLEHLRIGSPDLETLPRSVACLKGLKELIMLGCLELDDIAPIEELKLLERLDIYESQVKTFSPRLRNVKVLTIYGSPITEFSFQTQDVMDALIDFTLGNTSISKICIPSNVCPRLEEVDLSDSFQLKQVQGFPRTLVRLTLEGCSQLEILTNLSDLVHLRFLNINRCTKLETLNVEGLTSLEEISAEECWKLQSMEAFNQLERLNFLRVSTYMQGRHFSNASDFDKLMQSLMSNFQHVTARDVPATTTVESPARLNDVLSHKAVIVCFITNRANDNGFCVCFEPSNNLAQDVEYKTFRGGRSSGRMLHMYMWTKDSKLFQDKNMYTNVVAYRSGGRNELDAGDGELDAELDAGDGEKGWIVTLASETQVLEVCKQIMFEGIYNPQGMS